METPATAWFCALFLLSAAQLRGADYAIGADLSFLKQAEDRGMAFKDAGQVRPGLEIFRNHGYNWIRLRLFHTPARLPNGLDYHYSDTWAATKRLYDKLHSYGVEYDVMGQSYYPWWHSSILDLRECLTRMALEYRKPIILVEAAFCWRPTEYLKQPGPFPETPEGQREFLEEVNRAVLAVPNGLGQGVFWWEPAVAEGRLGRRSYFDEQGNALPVINVFDRFTRGRPK